MIITPLSKGSIIPAEEKNTAEVLSTLPDNWLCISGTKDTYFSFLKDNKKIRGTQIDFVIINEYGIFFLEVKNVSLIKSEHNNLIFQSQNKEEYDPLYRAIEYPNLAKNWFLEKFRDGKITDHLHKKSDLKFGIWGTVVISNDNFRIVSPQKELKLDDIIHHKQMNIIHRKEINPKLFKKFYQQRKAPHHDKLSTEDVFLIFNIMLNQNLPIDSVLTAENERVYELLKYQNKYQTSNSDRLYDKQQIIESLKEENEEVKSNIIVLRQEYDKALEEHKIDLQRLEDRAIMQNSLESNIKNIKDENNKLISISKKQENLINTNFDALFNAVRSAIREKINTKNLKEDYDKKLKRTKNIRILNYLLFPIIILLITTIIILSFYLSSEISKEPPTPSDIFNKSYVDIREFFNKNQYDDVINYYESMKYSFEFLTSSEVIEFRYYLGYSYFREGNEGSSIKDAGVKILLDIKTQTLSETQILNIYPEVFEYLWKFNRYSESGKVLSIIETTLEERENSLLNSEQGLFKLIDGKIFLIKALNRININNSPEMRVMDYLEAELINKGYIIEDYLNDIYNYMDNRVINHISKLSNSEYPPIQSNDILADYLKINEYIEQINDMKIDEFEIVRIRFTKLHIQINSEIGRIYSINKSDYEMAVRYLEIAEKSYIDLRRIIEPTSITDISTYTNMYLLMAKAYEIIGDLCSAYEAYWNSEKLAKKIAGTFPAYSQILAKIDTLKNQIEENDIISGLENCSFETTELKNKYN